MITEAKDALLSFCWWGVLSVLSAQIRKPEPELASPDEHYYGRELVSHSTVRHEEEEEEQQEPENEIEMTNVDADNNYVTIESPTLYDTVNSKLHRNRCPICYDEPAAVNVSVVVLPCSHAICGCCLYRSLEHAMDVTGVLNCPLCLVEFEA